MNDPQRAMELKSMTEAIAGNTRTEDTMLNDREIAEARLWLKAMIEKGRREPHALIDTLTPARAYVLLENNPNNRSIGGNLRKYIRDVGSISWDLNGASIVVAKTGELNDGQHRCLAVLKTGRAIKTTMTFGVDRETRRTLDSGSKRKIGHKLIMDGYADGNKLGHAASVVICFDQYKEINRTPERAATDSEVQSFLDSNPSFPESLTMGRAIKNGPGGSVGLFAALHYILSRVNSNAADEFFDKLTTGTMLTSDSPIHQLRAFLIKEKGSKRKYDERVVSARCIKAWNYYRLRTKAKKLSWGDKPDERFPTPV